MLTRRMLFSRVAVAAAGIPFAAEMLEARPGARDLATAEMIAVFSPVDEPISARQAIGLGDVWRHATKGTAFEGVPAIILPRGVQLTTLWPRPMPPVSVRDLGDFDARGPYIPADNPARVVIRFTPKPGFLLPRAPLDRDRLAYALLAEARVCASDLLTAVPCVDYTPTDYDFAAAHWVDEDGRVFIRTARGPGDTFEAWLRVPRRAK